MRMRAMGKTLRRKDEMRRRLRELFEPEDFSVALDGGVRHSFRVADPCGLRWVGWPVANRLYTRQRSILCRAPDMD